MAIAFGAMGAHFLKSKVEAGLLTFENLQTFETAVRYQIYHTLAMFGIIILKEKNSSHLLNFAAYCFIIGILFFSGSLYLLSLRTMLGIEHWHWLGPITPLGGLFFITGWILIFISSL